ARGRVRRFDSAGGVSIDSSAACTRSKSGHFNVQVGKKIFELSDKGFVSPISIQLIDPVSAYIALSPSWAIWRTDSFTSRIRSFADGRSVNYPFGYPITSHETYSIIGDSLLYD